LKYSPVLVQKLVGKGSVEVACGNAHSVVLVESGKVYSWGSNESGQTGTGGSR
jgi:alpha-tubulin suppressor-like RCC1 family protein